MKKTVFMLLTFGLLTTFVSCKKDYTCECVTTPGNSTDKTTLVKVTKRQAKANCYSYSYDASGTKVEVNCTLK